MKTQQHQETRQPLSSRHHKTNRRNQNRKCQAMQLMVMPRKPFRRMRRTSRRQIRNHAQPVHIRNHARQRHHRSLFAFQRKCAVRHRPPRQKMCHRIHRRHRILSQPSPIPASPSRWQRQDKTTANLDFVISRGLKQNSPRSVQFSNVASFQPGIRKVAHPLRGRSSRLNHDHHGARPCP